MENLNSNLLDSSVNKSLAGLFKLLGDPTRLSIVNILLKNELSVGDISREVGMSESAVSHQLRVLNLSNVVKHRRDGKQIFYSLDDEHIEQIFDIGLTHILEHNF